MDEAVPRYEGCRLQIFVQSLGAQSKQLDPHKPLNWQLIALLGRALIE